MMLLVLVIIVLLVLLNFRYKQGYSWKDIFSPVRWKAVYIWVLKKQLKYFKETNTYLTKNELLQYSYRVAKCTDCLLEGKCKHCGCDTEGRMNGVTDSCSAGKFGVFLTDEELDELLKENKLVFNVKIEKKDDIV